MKKTILFLLILLQITFFCNKTLAQAPLKTGDINASIRIKPEDGLVAGTKSEIQIIIDDSGKKFSVKNCSCELNFIKDEKLINRITDFDNEDINIVKNKYVFPEVGRYEIKLVAKPNPENLFRKFNVSFYVNVEKEIVGVDKFIYNLSDFRGQILFSIVAFTFALFIIFKRITDL